MFTFSRIAFAPARKPYSDRASFHTLDCKTVRIFAYSSTRKQSNGCVTLTPRFSDFFTDFEEKNRLFYCLFTHKNGDFGAISVTERSCDAPISWVESQSYRIGVHTRPNSFSCRPSSHLLSLFKNLQIPSTRSRCLYFLFKGLRARVIKKKKKPQGIYWPPAQGGRGGGRKK